MKESFDLSLGFSSCGNWLWLSQKLIYLFLISVHPNKIPFSVTQDLA